MSISRSISRHLVPSFVSALYFSLRYRCLISPSAKVQLTGKISFGRGTVVKAFAIVQSSGGKLTLGSNCAISSFCHVHAGADLEMGDYVRIGPGVVIGSTTRNYRKKDVRIVDQGTADRGIRIGSDVLIGSGAVILDGCEIGDGAVIGTGSLVSRNVAPYSVVFGSPAKVIFNRM